MNNFVCSKCSQLMKCTKTGRLLVFNRSMAVHGDQYLCPECGFSIVFTNSKSFDVSGFIGRIRDQAEYQQIQGRDADFPIEVKKSTGFSIEAQAVDRDLNTLDEKALQKILYASETDRSTVKLADRFTEVEIIHLIDHPDFDTFTPAFKETIWQSVSDIFSSELKRGSES